MNIDGYTKIYGLLGYPAKHSLSPLIHNYLFKKNQINSVYHVFEIPSEDFKQSICCLKMLGIEGFNLTMPYKDQVITFLNEISKEALILNSVNTVIKKDGIYKGFNTDISGFIRCLTDKDFDFQNSTALVLGAGSTARSVIIGLCQKEIGKLIIFNRTKNKAIAIKELVKKLYAVDITVLNDLENITKNEQAKFDLIVNSTTIGMEGEAFVKGLPIPKDWNLKDKFVFDMIYKPIETELLVKARAEKATIINGIDMLISQALDSFKIWTGINPDKEDLLKYLTKVLIKSD